MKYLTFVILLILAVPASAECVVTWVDHDFNVATPPVQQQLCDSTLDIPGINLPGIQPIQTPQIEPIPSLNIPPIGTTYCTPQSIYEDGQWVTRDVCY